MYLAGPDAKVDDTRRRVLKLLEDRMQTLRPFAVANPNEEESADPELDAADPLKGFGTPEQRKRVEQAAENAVIAHYENKGFDCERVTHLPCGYGPGRLLKYTSPMRGTLFQRTAAQVWFVSN